MPNEKRVSLEKMLRHLSLYCGGNACEKCNAIRAAIEEKGRLRERKLTRKQADEIEAETRRLEANPTVDKHAFRLYLESPMPCGHPVANLLMCEDPPYGCVICGPPEEGDFKLDGEEK